MTAAANQNQSKAASWSLMTRLASLSSLPLTLSTTAWMRSWSLLLSPGEIGEGRRARKRGSCCGGSWRGMCSSSHPRYVASCHRSGFFSFQRASILSRLQTLHGMPGTESDGLAFSARAYCPGSRDVARDARNRSAGGRRRQTGDYLGGRREKEGNWIRIGVQQKKKKTDTHAFKRQLHQRVGSRRHNRRDPDQNCEKERERARKQQAIRLDPLSKVIKKRNPKHKIRSFARYKSSALDALCSRTTRARTSDTQTATTYRSLR